MVTEAERFEMHLGLRRELGEDLGNLLMEHLPPTGWGDVARTQDVLALKEDLTLVRRDIDRVDRTLKWFMGVSVPLFIGLFALQVQVLLVVSRL